MDETISTTRAEDSEQHSKNLHEMERVGVVEYAISFGHGSEYSSAIKSGLLKFSKNVATTQNSRRQKGNLKHVTLPETKNFLSNCKTISYRTCSFEHHTDCKWGSYNHHQMLVII